MGEPGPGQEPKGVDLAAQRQQMIRQRQQRQGGPGADGTIREGLLQTRKETVTEARARESLTPYDDSWKQGTDVNRPYNPDEGTELNWLNSVIKEVRETALSVNNWLNSTIDSLFGGDKGAASPEQAQNVDKARGLQQLMGNNSEGMANNMERQKPKVAPRRPAAMPDNMKMAA